MNTLHHMGLPWRHRPQPSPVPFRAPGPEGPEHVHPAQGVVGFQGLRGLELCGPGLAQRTQGDPLRPEEHAPVVDQPEAGAAVVQGRQERRHGPGGPGLERRLCFKM